MVKYCKKTVFKCLDKNIGVWYWLEGIQKSDKANKTSKILQLPGEISRGKIRYLINKKN